MLSHWFFLVLFLGFRLQGDGESCGYQRENNANTTRKIRRTFTALVLDMLWLLLFHQREWSWPRMSVCIDASVLSSEGLKVCLWTLNYLSMRMNGLPLFTVVWATSKSIGKWRVAIVPRERLVVRQNAGVARGTAVSFRCWMILFYFWWMLTLHRALETSSPLCDTTPSQAYRCQHPVQMVRPDCLLLNYWILQSHSRIP